MILKYYKIVIVLWITIMGMVGTSYALDVSANQLIEEKVKSEAERLLSRYFSPEDFYVKVQVQPSPNYFSDSDYVTPTLYSEVIQSQKPAIISKKLDNVKFIIYLEGQLSKKKKSFVSRILKDGLYLRKKRGDSIRFRKLEFSQKSFDRKQPEEIKIKLENTIKDERKADNSDSKLSTVFSNALGKIEQQLSTLQASSNAKETPLVSIVLIICLSILIGFLILLFGISKIAKSVNSLGKSISSSALSVANANGLRKSYKEQQKKLQNVNNKQVAKSSSYASNTANTANYAKEINSIINRENLYIVSKYVESNAINNENIEKAVATLELLNKDNVDLLFTKLDSKSSKMIHQFTSKKYYTRPKTELFSIVYDELKTRLLNYHFEAKQQSETNKIQQFVERSNASTIFHLLEQLENNEIPRLLSFLDSSLIRETLKLLKNKDADVYKTTILSVPKIPEYASLSNFDKNIETAIKTIESKELSNNHKEYLNLYHDIVEHSETDISEDLVKELSNVHAIADYFEKNLIRIETYFQLKEEYMYELLDNLDNKTIAEFIHGLESSQQSLALSRIEGRKKEFIKDELNQLGAISESKRFELFEGAKKEIFDEIKDIKGSLTIEEIVSHSNENTKSSSKGALKIVS